MLELSKNDEYFLSIAKKHIHSFIMLGVVHNGEPKLLARVGKIIDVDPDFGHPCLNIKMLIGSGALARIADHYLLREKESIEDIDYQAYTINYQQLKEFYGMIAQIEKKQLENLIIQQAIEKNDVIKCYLPVEEKADDLVAFRYKKISEFDFSNDQELKDRISAKATPEIVSGAQINVISNTCRTYAKNIVEAILGYLTDISEYFFISLKYQTKLKAGQPDAKSFYILPPPPNTANVDPKQALVLTKLYQRIQEIPKLNPESDETRRKFDALKSIYQDIAGQNNLSAKELLRKILKHEKNNHNALFEHRAPNFFIRFFSMSSSTQKMFGEIENSFTEIIGAEEFSSIKGEFNITSHSF